MNEDIKYKEDYQLVDNYLNQDKESGRKLYEKIFPILERYVYKNTTGEIFNYQDQQDIIVNTLYKSIELLERYNPKKSSFSTFVIGIAKNKIKEKYRERKKEFSYEFGNELTDQIPDEYNNPEYVLIKKEEIEAIKLTLQSLNEDYRNIIQLRKFNNVPVKQIAQLMGKSESSVDSLYRRAIIQFKEEFKKNY